MMTRLGYNQGLDDAAQGEPCRDGGNIEYYMAYRQFSRDEEPQQPEPSYEQRYPDCCYCIYGDTSQLLMPGFRCALRGCELEGYGDTCSAFTEVSA
jgi:hypothetical protein